MGNNLRLIILYLPVVVICLWTISKWSQTSLIRGDMVDSLPTGQYTLLKRSCLIAGREFGDHNIGEWKESLSAEGISSLALFDDVKERITIIGSKTMSGILIGEKCVSLIERPIRSNSNGFFSISGGVRFQYSPKDCRFTYTIGNDEFVDVDESRLALSSQYIEEYEIFQSDKNIFHLRDKKFSDYSDLGCRKLDKLVQTFQLKL